MTTDTSTDAVERFMYSLHSLAQYEDLPDLDKEVYGEAITLLRALTAERDALRAENERLRDGVIAIGSLIEPEHREAAMKRLNAKTPPG